MGDASCACLHMSTQAQPLLESVVRSVLLGRRCHGLFWHASLLDALLHQFLNHDFNVASVRRGLQARSASIDWRLLVRTNRSLCWEDVGKIASCHKGSNACRWQ